MTRDVIQLILWAVFGLFFTWGIFLAYVGFRSARKGSKRRIAQTSAIIALVVGIFWIIFWVSAVVWNAIEIIGAA